MSVKKKTIRHLSRTLSILLIIFVSLFALDVFNQPDPFLSLSVHLAPSFILIVFTIIAWKNKCLGFILFLVVAILSFIFLKSPIIYIPAFIISILYFIDGRILKDDCSLKKSRFLDK